MSQAEVDALNKMILDAVSGKKTKAIYMKKETIQLSPQDRILFVNIKNSYNSKDRHSEYYRPSVYEATRKYWRISKKRLDKINLVVGYVDGIVKEVIAPTQWSLTSDPRYRGRYECKGEELVDSPYLEKDIRSVITIGQNPVTYYNCD